MSTHRVLCLCGHAIASPTRETVYPGCRCPVLIDWGNWETETDRQRVDAKLERMRNQKGLSSS